MKKHFTASVWREGNWFVAHCNEIEIASQGETKDEALSNLKEAIELHFEEPTATIFPEIYQFEAQVNAAF
jgi:predicted RNase H-like HicB family nuclease